MGWRHDGGGCKVGSTDLHPCDDTYLNEETGQTATFKTTTAAHFTLPKRVADLREVRALPGVILSETTLDDQPPEVAMEDSSDDEFDWGLMVDEDDED